MESSNCSLFERATSLWRPGWNYTSSIVNHRCCSKWCYSNSSKSRVSTLEFAGPDDSQCYYLLSPLSVERFPPMWSNALLLLMFGNHKNACSPRNLVLKQCKFIISSPHWRKVILQLLIVFTSLQIWLTLLLQLTNHWMILSLYLSFWLDLGLTTTLLLPLWPLVLIRSSLRTCMGTY